MMGVNDWFDISFRFKMFARTIIILALLSLVKSAKILFVVPISSISHQIVFRSLIQELVNRDHDVTVITPDPEYPLGKSPKNLIEIDLHALSSKFWSEVSHNLAQNDVKSSVSMMTVSFRVINEIFHHMLQEKSVMKLIKDTAMKFDLLILEECVISTLIFSYIFKAPVIQMSSYGDHHGGRNTVGGLTHPFLYPTHFHERIYNLTIWEKINELYNHIQLKQNFEDLERRDDERLHTIIGADTPSLNKLKNDVSMLFLNVNPLWWYNQPVPSNFVYTWGIHKTPENILPKDLQSYLDSSKNGVIYMSFGTNYKTSSLRPDVIKILLNVFSRLPYNILWKWDTDELPEKVDNVKISKWFPQSDILRHPNMRLFITQGGLQSTQEAINAGVPLLGIPLFADQHCNIEKYVYFKIGLQLSMKSLTIAKLENAIKTIITNYDSYRKNVIHLRTQMQDQPKPPLENAIWWIEYVLRHGGARHLRAPAANMSWAEYYELELILIILSGIILLGAVVVSVLRLCLKLV